MLHAKSQLAKNKFLTALFHRKNEEVMQEKNCSIVNSSNETLSKCRHRVLRLPLNLFVFSKRLTLAPSRVLKMSDDVMCVKLSADKRLLAVSLLDNTIKVFFADTLKVGATR